MAQHMAQQTYEALLQYLHISKLRNADWYHANSQFEKGKARFSFLLQIKRLRY